MVELANDYATRLPNPRLRPFVANYTGYRMAGFEPGTHAGLPSGTLTMIVAFDENSMSKTVIVLAIETRTGR